MSITNSQQKWINKHFKVRFDAITSRMLKTKQVERKALRFRCEDWGRTSYAQCRPVTPRAWSPPRGRVQAVWSSRMQAGCYQRSGWKSPPPLPSMPSPSRRCGRMGRGRGGLLERMNAEAPEEEGRSGGWSRRGRAWRRRRRTCRDCRLRYFASEMSVMMMMERTTML